ncbi:small nuclear ribonucleoprotein (snRNP)-like protein [Brevibacillus nitrificans]|nr:small nuclear ribonucleoprotein (snRNP)-like protein [Brevibacillus nitrificans]
MMMGFDQKAMKLLGKNVQVKMFNGVVIKGTMTHFDNGYLCFITTYKQQDTEKTTIRRLAIKEVTSMLEV